MKRYGLRKKGTDGLCRVLGFGPDSDYFRLVGPDYDMAPPFIVTGAEMLDYLTNPPTCIQNGWGPMRPYPIFDLADVEIVEVTLTPVPMGDLLKSL